MRRYNLHLPAIGCAIFTLGVSASGCFGQREDCSLTFACPSESDLAKLAPLPVAPECIPKESDWSPPESCAAVFLSQSLGDDAGEGTVDKPVKTFARAIQLATIPGWERLIYACAEEFQESVLIKSGITIYGGFQCDSGWKYLVDGKKTVLTTALEARGRDRIPLTVEPDVSSDNFVQIHNVHVKALDGVDGGSSIAAFVIQAQVQLANCTLEARKGADGRPGEFYSSQGALGHPGHPGDPSCSGLPVEGAKSIDRTCVSGDVTFGGAGGYGLTAGGADGESGYPTTGDGNGGFGEKKDSEGNNVLCEAGKPGSDGSVGESGSGGFEPSSLADFLETLTLGKPGQNGGWGKLGQGGGGGGGSKSGGEGAGKCDSSLGGASGGSGGTGGCGGRGGYGGHAGGSSIALISLDSTFTAEGVELIAKEGGKGGSGGSGQEGGLGGIGGPGGDNMGSDDMKPGCPGGAGGKGGTGGMGGGGAGGYSVGIVYKGTKPGIADKDIRLGHAGVGGAGDITSEGDGRIGKAEYSHPFSK